MYSQMRTGDKIAPYIVHLVADTEDDIATLPTDYTPGSTCEVVATSTLYKLNNQKQWIKQTIASSGSGSGTTVEGSLASSESIDNLFN